MERTEISWRKSVGFRLFLTFSGLVAVISVFIFLYFPYKLRDESTTNILDHSNSLSQFIAYSLSPSLVFEDQEGAEEVLSAAQGSPTLSYLVVLDGKGNVFAAHNLEVADHAGYRKEGNFNIVTPDRNLYMTRTEVLHSGQVIGHLYTGHSLESLNASIARTRSIFGLISLGVFLLGAGFAYWTSRFLTQPLGRMVIAMERVGAGDLSSRTDIHTQDEMGILAQRFDHMVGQLNQFTGELQDREKQIRALVESMNEGLVELDEKLTIRFANGKFCKLFQVLPGEILGKSIQDVLHLEPHAVQIFLSHDDSAPFELEFRGAQEKSVWVLVSMAHVNYGDGSLVNAIFTDITYLKQTERNLLFTNRELDTFVYKASHDLKAPLSSLKGLVQVARLEVTDETALRYLDLIDRTTNKMDEVLLGLLEVSWIKQGSFEIAPVDMKVIVDSILQSISHSPDFQSVTLDMSIPDPISFNSDYKLLTSILQNLIVNAFKYQRTDNPDKRVDLRMTRLPSGLEIRVKDNGEGIDARAQERIFDMFFRANNRSKGSGLGLYIVKNAVEKLNGNISLQSRPGEGSEFRVFLPDLPPDYQ